MTASRTVPEAVTAYFESLNDEDWDRLATIWAADVSVLAVGARPRHGADEAMSLFKKLFKHWPKHLDIPGRTLIDGNTVTVEVHFVGTTEDGLVVEFDAVDVIDLEGQKIKRLSNWYDTARVRAMISGAS
jgi:ketosteroid isomerase-like protein